MKKLKGQEELRLNMLSTKGELVEDGLNEDRNPSMEEMRNNPYKTPPNNLTSNKKG